MAPRLLWFVFIITTLFPGSVVFAQIRQIDPKKLPHDERVQAAYSDALAIEPMAHSWSDKWTRDTPKERVASELASDLHDLRSAEIAAPHDEELLLLTGVVAHLAYNVDVEETYEVAVESFGKAHQLAPDDYRADWFLAGHRCQANEVKAGMEQMLEVEDRIPWQQLQVEFWDDYINCSTIALMPAHTLRAVDHAVHFGESASSYNFAVDVAHKRYKATDVNANYPAHEVWQATEKDGSVQFTSQFCGMGFSAHSDWHLDIRDVAKGICLSTIETGPYPSKSGKSTPTLLVLTRAAKHQETLENFVESVLKARYVLARPIAAISCPSEKCLAFEITDRDLYASEGGGHFLVAAFAGQPPDFPGLLFEKPDGPPPAKAGADVAYYHPIEKLQRLPGTLHSIVELDSNASIFEKANSDFAYLLKSIRLD